MHRDGRREQRWLMWSELWWNTWTNPMQTMLWISVQIFVFPIGSISLIFRLLFCRKRQRIRVEQRRIRSKSLANGEKELPNLNIIITYGTSRMLYIYIYPNLITSYSKNTIFFQSILLIIVVFVKWFLRYNICWFVLINSFLELIFLNTRTRVGCFAYLVEIFFTALEYSTITFQSIKGSTRVLFLYTKSSIVLLHCVVCWREFVLIGAYW